MLKTITNNKLYLFPLLLAASFLTTGVIIFGSGKVIAAFVLLPVLVILHLTTPPFAKVIFPMVMITFPITLQVFGKDAFSTGTVLIFVMLAWVVSKVKASATIFRDIPFFRLLFILVAIALVGMATKTPSAYWGPAVRHFLNFISSIALFFIIVHGQKIRGTARDNTEYIEKIITTLLLITVVHVFLMYVIFNYPLIERFFSIFLRRTQETLGDYIIGGIYTRGTTVFTGGEEFGELLVLLFPFALYKVFVSNNKIYWFVTIALVFGMLLSGTRSAFVLMALQALTFIYFLVPQKYKNKKILISLSFAFLAVLILPVFAKYAPVLMDRMQDTSEMISQEEDLSMIMNRSRVWPAAYDITKNTLSLFGHGPIQASKLGFPATNFHNLLMSLIFQFGVIGAIIFFYVFIKLLKRLLNVVKRTKFEKNRVYLLGLTCLLSFSCFLINEIKFEFNRSDSYQQFVWCFFAVFYLTANYAQNVKRKNEQSYYH